MVPTTARVGDAAGGGERVERLIAFRAAARSVAVREPVVCRPRKRGRITGDGRSFVRLTTRGLAEDYLGLCHRPTADLRRWIAEDRKRQGRGGSWVHRTTERGNDDDIRKQAGRSVDLADTYRIRRHTLPPMRGWVDAHRERGRGADRVLARPRASDGGYDRLRPLRAEKPGTLGDSASASDTTGGGLVRRSAGDDMAGLAQEFDSARALLLALYGARIEATRRSMSGRDATAAVRALIEEQRAALRALVERRALAVSAARREAEQLRRPPPRGKNLYDFPSKK